MVKNSIGSTGVRIFGVANIILLTMIGFVTLYPMLNMLFISFSSVDEVVKSGGMMLYPKSFDLSYYQYVFKNAGLLPALNSTLFITVVGTTVNLVLTSVGAYVLAEKELPGRNFFTALILFTMFFNGGLIPTYIVVQKLHLVDSLWALILPTAVSTFNLILARNFFTSVPISLKESARIDGASELRILISIMIPLSMPILATLSLFYGVGHWNEYTNAVIYINNPNIAPLQVLIKAMYSNSVTQSDSTNLAPPPDTIRCATVVLATLPIICVYPFLQRYFVQGVMIGSVKG